eukprot:scaffold1102_cov256-Pinguiococcus_pyrenoidosus.AAC.7
MVEPPSAVCPDGASHSTVKSVIGVLWSLTLAMVTVAGASAALWGAAADVDATESPVPSAFTAEARTKYAWPKPAVRESIKIGGNCQRTRTIVGRVEGVRRIPFQQVRRDRGASISQRRIDDDLESRPAKVGRHCANRRRRGLVGWRRGVDGTPLRVVHRVSIRIHRLRRHGVPRRHSHVDGRTCGAAG